jgi:hypothetical protein
MAGNSEIVDSEPILWLACAICVLSPVANNRLKAYSRVARPSPMPNEPKSRNGIWFPLAPVVRPREGRPTREDRGGTQR